MKNKRDSIYSSQHDMVVDFVFDEKVVDVFPDMIRRSVPGYESIITMLGVFAENYIQPDTRCYDLGCSLGAASLSISKRIQEAGVKIIAVDNSEAMVEKCRANVNQANPLVEFDVECKNIQDIDISNASMVVLNFTLQFLAPKERFDLIARIYQGLNKGGCLVLSEKIVFEDTDEQLVNENLQLAFKRANGYSDLEISQKRNALEKVLIPETIDQHKTRLNDAGFESVQKWFQCFNFVSFVATK